MPVAAEAVVLSDRLSEGRSGSFVAGRNTEVVIDIKALIERHAGISFLKPSHSKDGLEYHGPCPWCGGTDRCAIWPQIGRFSCAIRASGCGRSGDAIDFLRTYPHEQAMTYVEACEELGIDIDPRYRTTIKLPVVRSAPDGPPCAAWQKKALEAVELAEHCLWYTQPGRVYLDELHRRGLRDDILRAKRLGYWPLAKNGRWQQYPFEQWGLTQEMLTPAQWERGCIYVPDGLLIPWFAGGQLWKLTVKRPFARAKDEMAYGQVTGSRECLYNADLLSAERPAMMEESVLCALSVEQEAGDLVAPIATDGVTRTRQERWIARLCLPPIVLQSFDQGDENGAGDAAAQWWCGVLPNCVRWTPFAHDPNDMLRAGMDLRKWVELGISTASIVPEVSTSSSASPLPLSLSLEDSDESCTLCSATVEHYDECGTAYCTACFAARGMRVEEVQDEISSLERFAEACAAIAQVFPGSVSIERVPPGYTLSEHVKRLYPERQTYRADAAYCPVTLPALPRSRCPHQKMVIVKDGKWEKVKAIACAGKPGPTGWCVEHGQAHALLELGAKLGYPCMQLDERRMIEDGVASWEEYATRSLTRIPYQKAFQTCYTHASFDAAYERALEFAKQHILRKQK